MTDSRSFRIAVLGATGPVGKQVLLTARSRGHWALAVSRNQDKLQKLAAHTEIETRVIDVLDRSALGALAAHVDVFVVTAGVAPSDLAQQVEIAHSVTDAGAGRVDLVYVSSCWSYSPLRSSVLDESHPRTPQGTARYRAQAEDLIAAACRSPA